MTATVLALLLALLLPFGGGPDSPEVDWFVYGQSDHVLRWQTVEEYNVTGFVVAYAPGYHVGGMPALPPALWVSEFVPAQHPGTFGGALYELPAGRGRMRDVWLCTVYRTWWHCDMQPEAGK